MHHVIIHLHQELYTTLNSQHYCLSDITPSQPLNTHHTITDEQRKCLRRFWSIPTILSGIVRLHPHLSFREMNIDILAWPFSRTRRTCGPPTPQLRPSFFPSHHIFVSSYLTNRNNNYTFQQETPEGHKRILIRAAQTCMHFSSLHRVQNSMRVIERRHRESWTWSPEDSPPMFFLIR